MRSLGRIDFRFIGWGPIKIGTCLPTTDDSCTKLRQTKQSRQQRLQGKPRHSPAGGVDDRGSESVSGAKNRSR